jgi:hypothetical protein
LCLVAVRPTVKPILEELELLKLPMDLGLKYKVDGYLCAIIGDNLATNELAGLPLSFRSNSCKYCTVHYNQLSDPQLCAALPSTDMRIAYRDYSLEHVHEHPFKFVNVIPMPFTFDVFHDLNEGCIKDFICDIFLVVYCKTPNNQQKFVDGLERMTWHDKGMYYNYVNNNLKGKGMQVNILKLSFRYHNINYFLQFYELFLNLGCLGIMTPGSLFYRTYIQLRKILCFLMSECIYVASGNPYLSDVLKYAECMKEIKQNHGIGGLKFKVHHLIHYVRMTGFFGPPKFFSTIRYERAHVHLKNAMKTSFNRINIPLTIAERYVDKLDFRQILHIERFPTERGRDDRHKVPEAYLQFFETTSHITLLRNCSIKGIQFTIGFYYALKNGATFEIVKCVCIALQTDRNEIKNYVVIGEVQTIVSKDSNLLYFNAVPAPRVGRILWQNLFTPRRLFNFRNCILNDFYYETVHNAYNFSNCNTVEFMLF